MENISDKILKIRKIFFRIKFRKKVNFNGNHQHQRNKEKKQKEKLALKTLNNSNVHEKKSTKYLTNEINTMEEKHVNISGNFENIQMENEKTRNECQILNEKSCFSTLHKKGLSIDEKRKRERERKRRWREKYKARIKILANSKSCEKQNLKNEKLEKIKKGSKEIIVTNKENIQEGKAISKHSELNQKHFSVKSIKRFPNGECKSYKCKTEKKKESKGKVAPVKNLIQNKKLKKNLLKMPKVPILKNFQLKNCKVMLKDLKDTYKIVNSKQEYQHIKLKTKLPMDKKCKHKKQVKVKKMKKNKIDLDETLIKYKFPKSKINVRKNAILKTNKQKTTKGNKASSTKKHKIVTSNVKNILKANKDQSKKKLKNSINKTKLLVKKCVLDKKKKRVIPVKKHGLKGKSGKLIKTKAKILSKKTKLFKKKELKKILKTEIKQMILKQK